MVEAAQRGEHEWQLERTMRQLPVAMFKCSPVRQRSPRVLAMKPAPGPGPAEGWDAAVHGASLRPQTNGFRKPNRTTRTRIIVYLL